MNRLAARKQLHSRELAISSSKVARIAKADRFARYRFRSRKRLDSCAPAGARGRYLLALIHLNQRGFARARECVGAAVRILEREGVSDEAQVLKARTQSASTHARTRARVRAHTHTTHALATRPALEGLSGFG